MELIRVNRAPDDQFAHVRLWHKADIRVALSNVRFRG
jgi:hypothetical protein